MGSAPASEVLIDNLQKVFPQARINLNYGITEGGPVLLSWKHASGLKKPRTTVGYPLPGVEIKLVDGLNENEGVLHTRNPGVMIGYHNLPEETTKSLVNGWLDTGDILRRDEAGWFYFVGRVDDMFVTGGENIYPGDVETMLERHDDVMQAVVVPAPNALKAHVPHAFIVLRSGCILTEDEVKQHALANARPTLIQEGFILSLNYRLLEPIRSTSKHLNSVQQKRPKPRGQHKISNAPTRRPKN